MYQHVEAQQEFSEKAFREISPAAYPQLCGSWPGDEWPDDDRAGDRHNDIVSLCLPAEYAHDAWS